MPVSPPNATPDRFPGPSPDAAPVPAQELPAPARRALAEAEARRRRAAEQPRPPEIGGRAGPEPVRYGDWERNGLAVDF